MSKITLHFMQRFMQNLDEAIRNFVSSQLSSIDTDVSHQIEEAINDATSNIQKYIDDGLNNKANKPTIMSKTMAAGSTSVTFTGLPTTGFNLIDVYTTIPNLDYDDMEAPTASSLTITYEAQSEAVTVYLRIEATE